MTPITLRAVVVGCLLAAVLSVLEAHLCWVNQTWSLGGGSLLRGPVHALFVLVLLNTVLLRFWPGRSFTRGELLVIYAVLLLSVGFAHIGAPYLVSAIAYPFYMATPENGWGHMLLPHIPDWFRPAPVEVVDWFWQGSPEGIGVPWGAWLTPLVTWGSFTVALMAAMFCLGALLRRDWIERQRLAFPLVEVPLSVIGDGTPPTLRSTILSNRIFWIGFAIPAACALLGWLHRVFPAVPAPALMFEAGRNFAGMSLPWSVLGDVIVTISFPIIGIAFLVPTEVSLSLWLFYLLYRVQLLAWGAYGVAETGGTAVTSLNPRLFINFQEAGGFIVLSAVLLYQSRKTFRAAWRSLLGREQEESDPYAPLTGRQALLGLLLSNAFMLWWAVHSGMSWWSFALLIGVFYVVLIGCSRLVAAAGVMWADAAFFPRSLIVHTLGAHALGPVALTLYSYLSVIYMYEPAYLAMPQMMNSFKLTHTGQLRGKRFPWAAALAVVAVFAVGVPALLRVLYEQGAGSLGTWPFTSYPGWAFGELDASLRTPEPASRLVPAGMAIGGAFLALLVWLNVRFIWWPVSPVGYIMASSYFMNEQIWASALIAWVLATLVHRYGGLKLHRALRPGFVGLILGQVITGLLLAVLSGLFGVTEPPL